MAIDQKPNMNNRNGKAGGSTGVSGSKGSSPSSKAAEEARLHKEMQAVARAMAKKRLQEQQAASGISTSGSKHTGGQKEQTPTASHSSGVKSKGNSSTMNSRNSQAKKPQVNSAKSEAQKQQEMRELARAMARMKMKEEKKGSGAGKNTGINSGKSAGTSTGTASPSISHRPHDHSKHDHSKKDEKKVIPVVEGALPLSVSPDDDDFLKRIDAQLSGEDESRHSRRGRHNRSKNSSSPKNGKNNSGNSQKFQNFKDKVTHPGRTLKELFTVENKAYDPDGGEKVNFKGKSVKNKPRLFSVKKTIRNAFAVLGAMIVIFAVSTILIIATAPKIDPTHIYDQISQSSVIYDQDGKQIDKVSYGQDRTIIKYKDLNKQTVNAFVALEDKTFWKHHGFNWTRMGGAVLQAVTGHGSISGTSTITQQLARNVYLPEIKSQRSLKRKIIEMYYAHQIEKDLSKEQIITAYLNSIYFGFGNYGIEDAAKTYFSKNASQLTLEESAALAALPQSPDTYAFLVQQDSASGSGTIISVNGQNYVVNDISKNRRDTCLDLMEQQGYISK